MARTTHELKCWAGDFEELWLGNKTFDVRDDDREYRVGDRIVDREVRVSNTSINFHYTGREIEFEVTYVTDSPCVVVGLKERRRRTGKERWKTREARIAEVLAQHDGCCMDVDDERRVVAKAVNKVL